MRTSGEIDFRFRLNLKITLVESTYPSQRPPCPSLSPHFLLIKPGIWNRIDESYIELHRTPCQDLVLCGFHSRVIWKSVSPKFIELCKTTETSVSEFYH